MYYSCKIDGLGLSSIELWLIKKLLLLYLSKKISISLRNVFYQVITFMISDSYKPTDKLLTKTKPRSILIDRYNNITICPNKRAPMISIWLSIILPGVYIFKTTEDFLNWFIFPYKKCCCAKGIGTLKLETRIQLWGTNTCPIYVDWRRYNLGSNF